MDGNYTFGGNPHASDLDLRRVVTSQTQNILFGHTGNDHATHIESQSSVVYFHLIMVVMCVETLLHVPRLVVMLICLPHLVFNIIHALSPHSKTMVPRFGG